MKNLYNEDYEHILDVVVGATTSGLKRKDSNDRLLALKAMKKAADFVFDNARDCFEKKHKKIAEKVCELEELL